MSAQQIPGPKPSFQDGIGMLTRRLYFNMIRGAGRLLAPLDVTVEQYVALTFLAEEQGLTQQQLVQRCASDPRTMGKMLDVLAAKGWVQRVPHETDRRAWKILLSTEGRQVHDRMDVALIPFRERAVRTFGGPEFKRLKDMLAKLGDVMDPACWLTPDGKLLPPDENP